jgi:hypothetical protein
VENMEELYEWLISLNFLRFNAYYETFMISFGKVGFPLYNNGIQKKKKYIFDLEGKTQIIQYKHRRDNKHKTVKVILKNKNEIDINSVVYEKYIIMKKLINLGFINLIGIIQQGITKNKETEDNSNQLFVNNLSKTDNSLIIDKIKIPQHISVFENVRKSAIKKLRNRDPNSLASQIASKSKRTASLTLIKEDDGKDNEEEEEEEDDESSSKEFELLRAKQKEKDMNKKKEEKSIDKASENDKNEDKETGNKNCKDNEDNKDKDDNRDNDDNKDNEDNKDNDDIKDNGDIQDKKDNNENEDNKDSKDKNDENLLFETDEENDIEDEDYSSEKNQRLTNDFIYSESLSNYYNYDYPYKNYDDKLISSFNNGNEEEEEDDNDDILSKDNDLDSEATKIPNSFVKDTNIHDFVNNSGPNKEQNLINSSSKDFESESYEENKG